MLSTADALSIPAPHQLAEQQLAQRTTAAGSPPRPGLGPRSSSVQGTLRLTPEAYMAAQVSVNLVNQSDMP